MIKLGLPREPRWLTLGNGVKLHVRPLTTAVYEAARVSGTRKATAVAFEQGLIKAAGGTIEDLPDTDDRDGLAGLSQMFFAQSLAAHAIFEWEGVGTADGKPAAPTKENIEEMILDFPGVADDFLVRYTSPLAAAISEGNGSGASPSGTSEEAPNTVGHAEPKATNAPTGKKDQTENDALTA